MTKEEINNIYSIQKDFFQSGKSKDISFRKGQLRKLKSVIEDHENHIFNALKVDLNKSETEAYTSEILYIKNEIDNALKNISKWAKKVKVSTPLINKPGTSYYQYEAYGTVLVIAPWNYPFGLLFTPIIGAIAAGNSVIAKPSELSSESSRLIARMINKNFDEGLLKVVEGDADISKALINAKPDYIFFTGSTSIGKKIMKQASEDLIPLCLELGGKNPCIIDEETDLEISTKRIAWGKFFNSGQTCVAPDYLIVHKNIKDKFIDILTSKIKEFYSDKNYSKIINKKHFDRLSQLMDNEKIIYGGKTDENTLSISPTIIEIQDDNSKLMQEEIFGPILPIIEYSDLSDLKDNLKNETPLALYFFSKNKKKQDYVINNFSSGSVCMNGTLHILMSSKLPFGGLGESGFGSYHSKYSFETFSRKRAVLRKSLKFDLSSVYPPYKTPIKTLKKILKFFY